MFPVFRFAAGFFVRTHRERHAPEDFISLAEDSVYSRQTEIKKGILFHIAGVFIDLH
jgi:hypothetical protein